MESWGSSVVRTPPLSSRKKTPASDRFIPSRHLTPGTLDVGTAGGENASRKSSRRKTPGLETYRKILSDSILELESSGTKKMLSFADSPPKASTGRTSTLEGPSRPEKKSVPHRRIPKAAELILDAPELPPNFYLNLLDWSSRNIVAIGLKEEVYLWNCSDGAVASIASRSGDPVTSLAWDSSGRMLAIGYGSGEADIWNTSPQRKVRTIPAHAGRVDSLAWSSCMVASGGKDAFINCHDVRADDHSVTRYAAHKDEVCGLRFSQSEAQLASGSNDNTCAVWDMRRLPAPGRPVFARKDFSLHRFTEHIAAVKALSWSPAQANLLASGGGSADRCIRVWNTMDGSNASTLDTGSQVVALEWSPDGKELASAHGFSSNCVHIWKYPSFLQLGQLEGHRDRILHMAQSPDGAMLATAGADETMRIWKPLWLRNNQSQQHEDGRFGRSIR